MNKFILSILIAITPLHVLGQMFPLSDQYVLNLLSINPAFAGCHDALSATLLYRNQWVGFEDAPKTQALSLHAPVLNDKMGLGLVIDNNSIGIYRETSFIGNYAYRTELHNGTLALGLGFGITSYHNAWNNLEATDADDVLLLNNPASGILPTFSLGTYYYTKKYFIGISLPMFLSHELDQKTGRYTIKNNFSEYNYFLTGGYEMSINEQINLQPSVLVKYHPGHTLQMDCNVQCELYERFWIGLGYRNKNMLIGMLQCQLTYQIRMAYSYDFELGTMGKYRNGSHEIGLNYVFKYARNVVGPRQF